MCKDKCEDEGGSTLNDGSVCGTDCQTYQALCLLETAACRIGADLSVLHHGACPDFDQVHVFMIYDFNKSIYRMPMLSHSWSTVEHADN